MHASRAAPVMMTDALPSRGRGAYRVCFFILAVLLAASAAASHAEFARVGYLNAHISGPWKNYDRLFDRTYTHIIPAFMLADSTGAIDPVDALDGFGPWLFPDAQAAGTRVLFSIGGSTVSYRVYMDIASSEVAKRNFIDNVVAYAAAPDPENYPDVSYDGVDLNFEGWWYEDVGDITAQQRDAVDDLILDLSRAVKTAIPGAIVTTTLAPLYFLPVSPSAAVVNSGLIDMAHHMSYDFNGDNPALPNGPYRIPGSSQWLYGGAGPVERSVYGAFEYLYANGYDLSRVTGGVPFYGYTAAYIDTNWDAMRGDADWPAIPLHCGYLEKQHPDGGYWANDAGAIEAKIEEYRTIGLAGVMVWEVGSESPTGDLSAALYTTATRADPPLVFPQMFNFQPPLAGAPAPARRDSGAPYGSRGDYGWQAD